MKFALPLALIAATPVLAHPASLAHGHGAEYALPLGLALIAVAGLVARARAVRVRK